MRYKFTEDQEKIILDLYSEGYGCPEIARITKFSGRSKMHNFLKEKGLSRNSFQRYEKEFIKKIGSKNGQLELMQLTRQDDCPAWICKCTCGNETVIKQKYLLTTKSCGCLRGIKGSQHVSWNGYGELSGAQFSKYRNEAQKRDLSFNITVKNAWDQFIVQDSKCALTGLDLIMKSRSHGTASLDRIDSSLGYEINNIQWIHKWMNMLKSDLKEQDLFGIVKAVYEYKSLDKEKLMPIGDVLSRVYRKSSI